MKVFNMIMVMLILWEKKLCTWVDEESWVIMKTCFPDAKQIKQRPKSTLCQECTYVLKERNESEADTDYPPDNEPTFSPSYLLKNHTVNVKTIEK